MGDKDDHDLLVELNTKLGQLCKNTEKNYLENNKAHDKIIEKIDENHKTVNGWVQNVHERIDDQVVSSTNRVDTCHKTFLQSKIFYWVVGFIIAGLVSVWGFASVQQSRITKTNTNIENFHPTVLEKE